MTPAPHLRREIALAALAVTVVACWGLTRGGPAPAARDAAVPGMTTPEPLEFTPGKGEPPSRGSQWDFLGGPVPAFPPRPAVPAALPHGASSLRLTADLVLDGADYVALRRMAYCWSWFGNWTRMDPPVHGLGYVWEPDPRCSDFETTMDREAVCAALGSRPLMLVGDSITRQHYEYLNRTLGSDQRLPPLRVTPKSWDPEPDPSIVPHIQGLPYRDAICNGSEIRYLRADRLLMDGNPARALQGWAIDMRWTEQIRHYKGIVIMNRGAHPEQDERLLDEVRVAFGYVRGAAPHALQFWRTTPPGHAGCGGIKEPLAEVQPGEGLPYSWGTFWNQSKLVVDLINGEYPSVLPLDVSLPTGLKGDGHTDCLHYSNDDPYAYWTFLLVNMLKRLDAKARPARAEAR